MRIIPITKLRNFYNSFTDLYLRTATLKSIVEDLNRNDNYKKLIEFYNDSKEHFSNKYFNDEPFISNSVRKQFKSKLVNIKSTFDVCYLLYQKNICSVVNNNNYNFQYLEREISPIRTTNAEFDTGTSGKPSGTGGIDFIGWNIKDDLPVIGEIKLKNDKNAFYAIIQLLTYLSELTTPNQLIRIANTGLFKDCNFNQENASFYLYILLTDTNKYSDSQKSLLKEAKTLAINLSKYIYDIKEFVFLNLDTSNQEISLI